MKPLSQSVVCEHCSQKLSSLVSLESHKLNNQRCIKMRQKEYHAASEAEAEGKVPEKVDIQSETTTVTDSVKSQFLGLVKQIVTRHGDRDDIKNKDSLIRFLEEEVDNYTNSLYDSKIVERTKTDLRNWLLAFRHHVNAVWAGVQKGVFNPARGRGGMTAKQQEIVAAYMLTKWKSNEMESESTKQYNQNRMALYAGYETLKDTFKIPKDNPLGNIYGKNFVFKGKTEEFAIQTIEDWANVISYFNWMYEMAKKAVRTHLKNPTLTNSINNVIKQNKQHYDEVLKWLSQSPDGYLGPRSIDYTQL